jgi:hypothetical protein
VINGYSIDVVAKLRTKMSDAGGAARNAAKSKNFDALVAGRRDLSTPCWRL